ncbi:MAG: hypothetical protein ACI8Q3_001224, partial [Marinomonas primoryensis]
SLVLLFPSLNPLKGVSLVLLFPSLTPSRGRSLVLPPSLMPSKGTELGTFIPSPYLQGEG